MDDLDYFLLATIGNITYNRTWCMAIQSNKVHAELARIDEYEYNGG